MSKHLHLVCSIQLRRMIRWLRYYPALIRSQGRRMSRSIIIPRFRNFLIWNTKTLSIGVKAKVALSMKWIKTTTTPPMYSDQIHHLVDQLLSRIQRYTIKGLVLWSELWVLKLGVHNYGWIGIKVFERASSIRIEQELGQSISCWHWNREVLEDRLVEMVWNHFCNPRTCRDRPKKISVFCSEIWSLNL